MTIAERIMSWIRPRRCDVPALDARIKDAIAEGAKVDATVSKIVASSEAEEAEANDLAGSVKARLVRLEERRAKRALDPRISVVIETIRIMEQRL